MLPSQWDTFKRAARREKLDKVPMALIVDSPWIPGYLGLKHMDYYLDPELWFESNLKIMREFPEIIFVPSWWMEYGMAAEPSILGSKIKFWQDNTPSEYHTLYRLEDIDQFPEYEVEADAFAALTLHRIGMIKQRIFDHGYILPMVTARGPLCTAVRPAIWIAPRTADGHRRTDVGCHFSQRAGAGIRAGRPPA